MSPMPPPQIMIDPRTPEGSRMAEYIDYYNRHSHPRFGPAGGLWFHLLNIAIQGGSTQGEVPRMVLPLLQVMRCNPIDLAYMLQLLIRVQLLEWENGWVTIPELRRRRSLNTMGDPPVMHLM